MQELARPVDANSVDKGSFIAGAHERVLPEQTYLYRPSNLCAPWDSMPKQPRSRRRSKGPPSNRLVGPMRLVNRERLGARGDFSCSLVSRGEIRGEESFRKDYLGELDCRVLRKNRTRVESPRSSI